MIYRGILVHEIVLGRFRVQWLRLERRLRIVRETNDPF